MHIMGKLALKICPFEWNRVLMRRELEEDACTCDIEMDLVASPVQVCVMQVVLGSILDEQPFSPLILLYYC